MMFRSQITSPCGTQKLLLYLLKPVIVSPPELHTHTHIHVHAHTNLMSLQSLFFMYRSGPVEEQWTEWVSYPSCLCPVSVPELV